MTNFLLTVILGVFQGSLDALLALGIVLIYRTTGVLNFAQAATGTLATYVVYWMSQGRGLAILWLAVPISLLVGGCTGVATYGAVRSIRAKRHALTAAVATLAMAILIRALIQQSINVGGYSAVGQFPDPFSASFFSIGDLTVAYFYVAAITCSATLALGIGAFLQWTRIGTMLRAMADNVDAVALCGGRITVLAAGAWFAGGVLAAVAGFFYALLSFNPSFLDPLFVASLIAAVLGGLRSLTGAFIGGIALEVGDNLFQVYGPEDYRAFALTFLIVLLIAVLVLAPKKWLAPSSRRLV